ncbi:hypothetical protein KAU86_02445 [bacterium]|nr:hypothetical protein [bacterium]
MEKANNSKFLGALGFLGFLGLLGIPPSSNYQHLIKFTYLSFLSMGSLLIFIPFDKSKIKAPINPKRKGLLGALGFLGFLGFLGNPYPQLAFLLSNQSLWT